MYIPRHIAGYIVNTLCLYSHFSNLYLLSDRRTWIHFFGPSDLMELSIAATGALEYFQQLWDLQIGACRCTYIREEYTFIYRQNSFCSCTYCGLNLSTIFGPEILRLPTKLSSPSRGGGYWHSPPCLLHLLAADSP